MVAILSWPQCVMGHNELIRLNVGEISGVGIFLLIPFEWNHDLYTISTIDFIFRINLLGMMFSIKVL